MPDRALMRGAAHTRSKVRIKSIDSSVSKVMCIEEDIPLYYNQGYSYRKIGELLGRSASTVCREANRNKSFMNVKPAYYPHTAQKKYLLRRSYCHRGMFQDPATQAVVSQLAY